MQQQSTKNAECNGKCKALQRGHTENSNTKLKVDKKTAQDLYACINEWNYNP